MIQDAAYERLLRRRRQTLHGEIGAAIERLEGGRSEHAALLTYHFSRSHHQEKATRFALLAGDHAVGLHARAEATTHYEMAFSIASGQTDSPEIQALMVDAALRLASVGASSDELVRDNNNLHNAKTIAESLLDDVRLSKVLYSLGRHAYVRGDVSDAALHGERALEIADRLYDEHLSAPAVNLPGRLSILQCEYARGLS